MKIKTEYQAMGMYVADDLDADPERCIRGVGKTPEDAINSLVELLLEAERSEGDKATARALSETLYAWVPVSERLPDGVAPEFDGAVKRSARVVVIPSCPQFSGAPSFGTCVHFKDGTCGWSVEGWNGAYTVTHWMPLPEAPK